MDKDIDLLVLSEPDLSFRCFYFRILLAFDSWVSRKDSFLEAKWSSTLFRKVNIVRVRKYGFKDLYS